MTLDRQVHQQEVAINTLKRQVEQQARIIEDLQRALGNLAKDSHPPIDFIKRIAEAINEKELVLAAVSYGAGSVTINTAKVHPSDV